MRIFINGRECVQRVADYDGDGDTGVPEQVGQKVHNDYADIPPSELGESLTVLMDDNIRDDTRMSGIDMRSRLHQFQTINLAAFDGAVSFGVYPSDCLFLSRQIKRLSCSIDGWRADQIVTMVGGKRENDQAAGGLKKWLGMGGGGGSAQPANGGNMNG